MIYNKVEAKALKINERELALRLRSPIGISLAEDVRFQKLLSVATPAYVAERVEIKRVDGGFLVGNIFTESKALSRVLGNGQECFLIVCTLGLGADKLVAKESVLSVSDGFVIDAMADAMTEALCDLAEREVAGGLDTSARFSPGYSDLPLSVGRDIVKLLGAEKLLGIKFTEVGMMVPRKSVSAIIPIRPTHEG